MAKLLEKTRKITSILKRSEEQLQDEMPYNAIARQLADIIHCNACIINSKGTLLGYFMRYKTNNDRVEAFFDNKKLPEDNDKEFADDDLILVEIASTVVGIQMLNFQREEDEKNIRRRTAVNMAVNTLSYSELRAVSAILSELKGNEGQLTASVIADRIGITRSVIVNALRKLESAGIIESRSLGMKGTYLKVLIPDIFEEIKKRDY